MWDMFLNSASLFVKGRLFREPQQVLRQWLIGLAVTVITVVVLGKVGAPLWLAVSIAAFGAGALQPYLFKDLKYT